jgi:hypothetical protein
LLTWVLLGTVTTVQCHGTDCHPTRTSQAVAGPHTMAVFPSPALCEAYRLKMEQMHQSTVPPQRRPDITVRKQMTYTCQEQGEGL